MTEGSTRLAALLERVPAVAGVFRAADLACEEATDRLRETLGRDPIGLPAPELLSEQALAVLREAAAAASTALARAIPLAPEEGGIWEVSATPVGNGSLGMFAVDIAESEIRSRALIDSNVVGVVVADEELIFEANEAFLEMVGYTQEDVKAGLSWRAISAPEHAEADDRAFQRLRDRGVAPPYEKELVRKDGGRTPVLLSGTRIREQPLRVISTIYDLSDRRAVEREIAALFERERKARFSAELAGARIARLQEITADLSAARSPAQMARTVVSHALEDLSASAGLLAAREGGFLESAFDIGFDAEAIEGWRKVPLSASGPLTDAARSGESAVLHRGAGVALPGGVETLLVLPLAVVDRVAGVLALAFARPREIVDEDLEFLRSLSQQAAVALERAQLFENRAYVAFKLQEGLLPERLPDIPGIESAVRYRSISGGGEVGGDFYDLFAAKGGRWGVAVGDVCGKGTEAAVVTGLARHTVRAVAWMRDRPSEVLAFLNDALRRHSALPAFCTVAFATLEADAAGGYRVQLASGGHPYPLVLRAGGEVEEIHIGGTMLGVAADPSLDDAEMHLAPGDALIVYTDGVIDARRPGGEHFGEARLLEAVEGAAGLGADAIAAAIEAAVGAFAPDAPADDRAILVVRCCP